VPDSVRNSGPVGQTSRQAASAQCLHKSGAIRGPGHLRRRRWRGPWWRSTARRPEPDQGPRRGRAARAGFEPEPPMAEPDRPAPLRPAPGRAPRPPPVRLQPLPRAAGPMRGRRRSRTRSQHL